MVVALRKESVDRNSALASKQNPTEVALRKESVDRNFRGTNTILSIIVSLSARRAWIEMPVLFYKKRIEKRSLSARRAWIEILFGRC